MNMFFPISFFIIGLLLIAELFFLKVKGLKKTIFHTVIFIYLILVGVKYLFFN